MNSISLSGIHCTFGYRTVLRNISATFPGGAITGIRGSNGTGKSTLIRIAAGLLSPSAGSVEHRVDGAVIGRDDLWSHIGLIAPWVQIWEEFTPVEHLEVVAAMRASPHPAGRAQALLHRVQLDRRANDPIAEFSSGLKQRARLAVALAHSPPFLFLDEPATNLDEDGIRMVHTVAREEAARGCAVVLASNEQRDLALCSSIVDILPAAVRS